MWCYYPGAWDMALIATAIAAAGIGLGLRERWQKQPKHNAKEKRRPPTRLRGRVAALGAALLVIFLYASYEDSRFTAMEDTYEQKPHKAEKEACRCTTTSCLRNALEHQHTLFRPPHFWLGGCQKCGTTSMYDLLSKHPQIIPPTPKEPGYFALPSPLRSLRARWYVRDVLQLSSLCEKGLSNKATFDGTAYYLQWDYSAALALRQAAPWAKLVIILREPITRAMSWLQHMNMKFPLVPNCLRSRSMDCCVRQRWFLRGNHHLGGSLYDAHLEKWLDAGWPLQQFLIIKFEDLFEDHGAENVYGRILDFVGLQAHNLSSTTPSNRRSTVPYEVLPDAYDDMVEVVRDDVASLERRLGRSFGWADIWKTQRSQCKRDGVCRVDLIPRAPASSRPPGSRRFPGARPPG